MRILVLFKICEDPDRVLEGDWETFSLHTDLSYAGVDFNCFDGSALEMGLKLKEEAAVQGENTLCTALTLCRHLPEDFAQRLYSIGYDSVQWIPAENREFQPETVGEVLGEAARGYDLVLMGREAPMEESGQVPYVVARKLGYPMEVLAEEARYEGGLILRTREKGTLTEKRVQLPLAVTVGNSPLVLRGATLRQRMKCRGMTGEKLEIPVPEGEFAPSFAKNQTGRTCRMLDPETPETYALIRGLLQAGKSPRKAEKTPENSVNLPGEKIYLAQPQDGSREALEALKTVSAPLILLPDDHFGRLLGSMLRKETGRSLFFGGRIRELTEKTVTAEKPCFGGNLRMSRELPLPAVVTTTEFAPFGEPVVLPKGKEPQWLISSEILEIPQETALKTAGAVLVCGNGMGTKANCDAGRAAADKLGLGFGLTRPAALNAWGSPTEILGQSGLQIQPNCCLVLGAAGAGAFLLGVQGAKTLIAVNRDPNALIFKSADYGIRMDAMEFLKKLMEKEG